MNVNRRLFCKTVGLTGVALVTGSKLASAKVPEEITEFKGILYDSTLCIGCRLCEVTCAEAHGFPVPEDEPVAGVVRKTSETQRTVINLFKTSKGDVYTKTQCMHCNEPACAAACLTKAMYKTKEGPVIWRGDKCMGCRYCMVSCPFDVPKFEYHSANPKIQKCDMCYDRITAGGMPACVEACGQALKFGTRRELLSEAHKRISDNPGAYEDYVFGERVAGGTSFMYIGPVPFEETGHNTSLQEASYPALTKGFLYAVPAVFVLLPSFLLGIRAATGVNNSKTKSDE
jgi:Fe-S-cluster-containing dehydrogenase component